MLKPLRSHRVWRESIQVFMVMCMVIVSERLGVAMEDGEVWVLPGPSALYWPGLGLQTQGAQ